MVKRRTKLKKSLKREVDLPVPLPKNKFGAFLGKSRQFPGVNYVKNSWIELKKVTWLGRKDSLRLTFAVIVFSLFFTLITTVADAGFSWLVERVIL